MDNQFDLEQFADLFDTAMSSDNPTVQRAFKNLLLVAAIADSEEKKVVGPMRELLDELKALRQRVNNLESQWIRPQTPTPYTPGTPMGPVPLGPYVPSPTTWPNTGIPGGVWYSNGTGNIPVSATGQGASSTAYDDQFLEELAVLPPSKYESFIDKFK